MGEFPKKLFGICPVGHNLAPSGTTGDYISTTQIPRGEWKPLFWSNYYQTYVCRMCIEDAKDRVIDEKNHQKNLDVERKLAGMGIVKN